MCGITVLKATVVASILTVVALAARGLPATQTPGLEAKYYIGDSGYASTPAVADLDRDGHPEIVFGTLIGADSSTGHLDVIRKFADNTVELVWSIDLGGATFSPAIGDIDMDGCGEIVVYVFSGPNANNEPFESADCRLFAINHDGTVLWESVVGAPACRSGGHYNLWNDHAPALGDVNGDGCPDVAIFLGDLCVHVLDGSDGDIMWVRGLGVAGTYFDGKTAIMDLDQDGSNEVLVVGGRYTYVFRSDGVLWWKSEAWGDCDLAAGDVDGDGNPEIISTALFGIYVRAYDGSTGWRWPVTTRGCGAATADLDGDGLPEIVVGDRGGYVFAIRGDNTELWRSPYLDVGEWDNPDLSAVDLDGDSTPDIVALSDDVGPIILDGRTGNLLWVSDISIDENEHSPVIADVDNDGHAEIVFSGSYSNPPYFEPTYPSHVLVVGNDIGWQRARNIWNQMSYCVTNINDDLSITDYTPWRTLNTWRTQLSWVDSTLVNEDGAIDTPEATWLLRIHPNPVKGDLKIEYSIPTASCVNLSVYNVAGRLVETLVDGWREGGIYSVSWDGSALRSGVYLCQLKAGEYCQAKKVVVLDAR